LRHQKHDNCLVVLTCFNHLEKYESQWEGLSHIMPNILWRILEHKSLKPPTSYGLSMVNLTHMLHVSKIYQHVSPKWPKCRKILHTWSIWVRYLSKI
jgi:hypothetical protein